MIFSYFEGGILNTTPKKEITLNELILLIRDPNKSGYFDYLRKLKVEDEVNYKKEKKKLPYITPPSLLKKRKLTTSEDFETNFIKFSGYVYFDLDSIEEPEKIKKSFIENFPTTFSFICLSTSGKGLSFFIRIKNPISSKQDYKDVWVYLKEKFFSGYDMDKNVNDIGRSMFIGYDPNPYFNTENLVVIENIPKTVDPIKIKSPQIQRDNTNLQDDVFRFIPIEKVFEELKFDNTPEISRVIVDVFPLDHVHGSRYFGVKDGKKTITYVNLIHRLCFLNPSVDPSYIFNYIRFVNDRNTFYPKMDYQRMKRLFSYTYKSIIDDPDYVFKGSKTKRINFQKGFPFSRGQKVKISGVLNGILKKNRSIQTIIETKLQLTEMGEKITQKKIEEVSGLSLGTIKRYYRITKTEDLNWWIEYFNSEEYLDTIGFDPNSDFNQKIDSFGNQLWFHHTCPDYVKEYCRKRRFNSTIKPSPYGGYSQIGKEKKQTEEKPFHSSTSCRGQTSLNRCQ